MGDFVSQATNIATLGAVDLGAGAEDLGDAARAGAAAQASAQREALEYLKEREALPQQFREGALTQLGGLYGLEGGEGSQQALINQAMQSPLYQSLVSGGEESVLRNAAATGGLRSGNVQDALVDAQNRALLESYNQQLQGLTGLANLPSNANQIAQQTAGIGQTVGQGIIGGAQTEQAALNQITNQALGLGGMAFSDRRLKSNIQKIGEKNGHEWFRWEWNDKAKEIGLSGKAEGVIADLIEKTLPDAVREAYGYKTVDYDMLGVR